MTTTASAAPTVLAALKTLWTSTLGSSAQVYYGYGISSNARKLSVMVGVSDPFGSGPAISMDGDADWAYANTTAREETGTINCTVFATDGKGDPVAVMARLTTAIDAMFGAVLADPTLGIAYLLWSTPRVISIDQDQEPSGADALAVVAVRYRAHLT